jgi:hypothetical protein
LGYEPLSISSHGAGDPPATIDRNVAPTQVMIDDLFRVRFRKKLLEDGRPKGSATFVVKGVAGGIWNINLNMNPPSITVGAAESDCTITIRAEDLLKIANGDLNVGDCYLQARIKLAGNEALAVSIGQFLLGGSIANNRATA